MSEKRFRVNDLAKYIYSEIGEYVDEKHTLTPLRNDELCKLLNELNDENKKLRQERERWKNLYEIKDAEVTARVDSLNKVCEYYLTEAQFKADTDPNEAVHEVINRILNTEVKW